MLSKIKVYLSKKPALYYGAAFFYRYMLYPVIFVAMVVFTVIEGGGFLLRNNKKIFCNNNIYVFWHWSFGHQVFGYDWGARLYYPNRVTLIHVPHKRNNIYLNQCFEHCYDVVVYTSKLFGQSELWGRSSYLVIRMYCLVIALINKRYHIVDHVRLYDTLSLLKEGQRLVHYNDNTNKLGEYVDLTGYVRLLRDNVGVAPSLPARMLGFIEDEIVKEYPSFFEKPFVCLLLRRARSDAFYDLARDCADQTRYIKSVMWLCNNGYHVVGTGETDDDVFASVEGYYVFDEKRLPPKKLNLYLLMRSEMLITQHSGAIILPASVGVRLIITDSFPYYIGSYSKNDIVLFKPIYYKSERLSLEQILSEHSHVIYGEGVGDGEYEIGFNSEDEICNAVKGKCLVKKSFPLDTLIYYQDNYLVDF